MPGSRWNGSVRLRRRRGEGPPVWHHGDLDVRNWLVRDGRISGVKG
jgi:aminoglycoside phosphotransferase (APT) family kinase protein